MSGIVRSIIWVISLLSAGLITLSFLGPKSSSADETKLAVTLLSERPLDDGTFLRLAESLTEKTPEVLARRDALLAEVIRRNPRNRRALRERLIQKAEERDVAVLVETIDHLYRLDRLNQDVLVGMLASVIGSGEDSRAILSDALSDYPLWGEPLMRQVVTAYPDSRLSDLETPVLSFLSAELRLKDASRASVVGELYIDRLIASRQSELGYSIWWRLYGPQYPREVNVLNANSEFLKPRFAPPFDWDLIGGPDHSASIRGDGTLNVGFFGVNGTTILRQFVPLHAVEAIQLSIENPSVFGGRASRYEWRLRCLSNNRNIGRYITETGRFEVESPIFLTGSCEMAELSLFVDRGEIAGRSSLRVDAVKVLSVAAPASIESNTP